MVNRDWNICVLDSCIDGRIGGRIFVTGYLTYVGLWYCRFFWGGDSFFVLVYVGAWYWGCRRSLWSFGVYIFFAGTYDCGTVDCIYSLRCVYCSSFLIFLCELILFTAVLIFWISFAGVVGRIWCQNLLLGSFRWRVVEPWFSVVDILCYFHNLSIWVCVTPSRSSY